MAVGVDATGTVSSGTVLSPFDYTGLTIGSIGAQNPALIVAVWLSLGGVNWSVPTKTMKWNSTGTPQSMFFIGLSQDSAFTFGVEYWGLRNPTTGAHTLEYAWTGGSAPFIEINAISLIQVNQASDAAAFKNFASASNASSAGPASIAVTSAVGDMAFFSFAGTLFDNDPLTSPASPTEWTADKASIFAEGYRAAGAAPVTFTGTAFGGTQAWAAAGCDVGAAATIGTTTFHYNLGVNI